MAPETPTRWPRRRPGWAFNEAGATMAPETAVLEPRLDLPLVRPSMRPGQQWPRKLARPAPRALGGAFDPSMRPGQQWPRKPARSSRSTDRYISFNEAGATMAPETPVRGNLDGPFNRLQ